MRFSFLCHAIFSFALQLLGCDNVYSAFKWFVLYKLFLFEYSEGVVRTRDFLKKSTY